jgi:hypothetical protein
MLRRIARSTFAVGLTLCLSLAFTPLGCGGSGGSQGDGPSAPHGGEDPTVPASIVPGLSACAEQGRALFTDTTYAFQFDVAVTESGHADRVKVKGSYPSDPGTERCMARALEGMAVPPYVVQALLADAFPPESRGAVGFVMVIGGAVALVPVAITAAGVTVLVGVTVSLAKEAVETIRQRRKRRQKCLDMFETCVNERPWSCNRIVQRGMRLCAICRDKCDANNPADNKGPYEPHPECYQCGFSDPF